MTNYYIKKDNKIVGFDINKTRLQRTIGEDAEILETERPLVLSEDNTCYIFADTDDYRQEKLKQAKEIKLKEILEKAYEYENQTGLVSFDGRVSETETQVLHTELFNQGKFFQMVIGFSQGVLTSDQLYNTKEDINVLINSEEAQAIYFAIKNATEKLWTVDYLYYKSLIEQAETVEDVEAVVVDYTVGKDTGNIEETTEDSSIIKQGD